MVTDEYGTDPTLRYKDSPVNINALTMISKRVGDARITLQKYPHVIGDAQRRAVDSLAGRVLELTR